MTAVFEVFDRRRKGETLSIRHPRENTAVSLFPSETLGTDPQKAARVEKGMERLAADFPETVYMAWLSELPGVEDELAALIKLGFDENKNPCGNLTHPVVLSVNKALRQTGQERQRMLQFVRFVQVYESGQGTLSLPQTKQDGGAPPLYVADISPNSNVLPLIADHFHGRFNDQRLLIRDIIRRLVLVSQQSGWFIRELAEDEALPPLPEDGIFEELWRGYFHAVSNPARQNLKLQQHFIPLRYRKHLTEFQQTEKI